MLSVYNCLLRDIRDSLENDVGDFKGVTLNIMLRLGRGFVDLYCSS